MLVIAAPSFDLPSETFIRSHALNILPGRTALICSQERNEFAEKNGFPSLAGVAPWAPARNAIDRVDKGLRQRLELLKPLTLSDRDQARALAFLQSVNASCILVEYLDFGVRFQSLAQKAGLPLFVHAHGNDVSGVARRLGWKGQYRKLFKNVAGVIVPSQFLAEKVMALGADSDLISVCYNGIATGDYSMSLRKPNRLLAVARFVEKKGPLLTLKAFAKVHAARNSAKLVMVGDGPLLSEAKAFVANNRLDGSVEFLGACPREVIMSEFSSASVFLQHSITAKNGDTEGFGITLVEAMASGIPVVATRHNGFVETVEDGDTGFLVPEFDIPGMADATLKLLDSPDMAHAMGTAGRERASRLFSENVASANLRRILGLQSGKT